MTNSTWLRTTQPTSGGALTAVLANCADRSHSQQSGRLFVFLASRPCGPTGWLTLLLIKAPDVETIPGPTTTRKQVRICAICHR